MSPPGCVPRAQIDAGTNFQHYARLVQTAERGKFDLMFLADALAVRDGKLAALSRWPQYMAYFDPVTLLSAIAALTDHIGLVATATTSYNEPYNIARKFASLDHISGGRAGWNVVTSSNLSEAYNFGREAHFEHDERYDRAIEFADIVWGGRRRVCPRPRLRPLFRPGEAACVEPQRKTFLGARAAECRAAAAGSSGYLPGRLVGSRPRTGGADRGGSVHTAAQPGERARILSRPERTHGQIRATARGAENHARA